MESELLEQAKRVRNLGYRLIASPARPKAGGTSGGVCILARSHLAVYPVRGAPCVCSGPYRIGFGMHWCAAQVSLRKGTLLLVTVYMTDGIGMAGVNLARWREIVDFLFVMPRWPVAILGDWNMTPRELEASGALASMAPSRSLHVWCAPVASTCTMGSGRHIDYGVVDSQAARILGDLSALPVVPWKVHSALDFSIAAAPRRAHCWHPAAPKALEPGPYPADWRVAAQASPAIADHRGESELAGLVKQSRLLPALIDVAKARQLGRELHSFGNVAEAWLLQSNARTVAPGQLTGRLSYPTFTWRPAVARAEPAQPDDGLEHAARWEGIATTLAAHRAQHKRGADASVNHILLPQQRAWLWSIVDNCTCPWGKAQRVADALQLIWADPSEEELMRMQVMVAQRAKVAQEKVKAARGASVEQWARSAIDHHARGAFKYLKSQAGMQERGSKGGDKEVVEPTYDANTANDLRCALWSRQWAAKDLDETAFVAVARQLRSAASENDDCMAPLTGSQLGQAATSIRASTALGSDGFSPKALAGLPLEGLEALASVLNKAEAEQTLPLQLLANWMVALPKPDAGERLIVLMAMVARVYFRARRTPMEAWAQQAGQHWDSAIRGSSPLRAAVRRSFMAERAGALGQAVVGVFLGLATFYDSLDPPETLKRLMDLSFPPLLLLMHAQAHWAPRYIVANGAASQGILVSRSVLAGSNSSGELARGYLHIALQAAHDAYRPVELGGAR